MKRRLINIATVIVALLVLMGTSGFYIFQNRCCCSGEETVSFHLTDPSQNDISDLETCHCKISNKNTCHINKSSHNSSNECCKSNRQNKTNLQHLKIASLFLITTQNSSVDKFGPELFTKWPKLNSTITPDIITYDHFEGLSPPLYGRTLLNFLNQLKLEVPPVDAIN